MTIGPDGEQTGEFSTLLNTECGPGPVDVHGAVGQGYDHGLAGLARGYGVEIAD
ncbi:hypothetical protein [Streptomyces microflavus]|uniref:hypothetical protein n=1 Tax=Streptomyces microflavus TaxID=1919 RepID=UPI003B21EB5D